MLSEHIIEPDFLIKLAGNRRNCSDFKREFTKPSPRVIGLYPKMKKLRKLALVGQSDDASELEKTRLIELLSIIKDCSFIRNSLFNSEIPFIDNISLLDVDPINHTCVLETENEDANIRAKVLTLLDFEQGITSLESQVLVPKTANYIAEALAELVRLSQDIIIVDPYFSTQPGVWNTFLAVLEKSVSNSQTIKKNITVLFDGSKNSARSCQFLVDTLNREGLAFINDITQVTFKDIRENGNEAIHNRYVITNLAGCSLPYGLQETNQQEQDEFSLLTEAVYGTRYQQYVELKAVDVIASASIK